MSGINSVSMRLKLRDTMMLFRGGAGSSEIQRMP
jgi:hypothetical protein